MYWIYENKTYIDDSEMGKNLSMVNILFIKSYSEDYLVSKYFVQSVSKDVKIYLEYLVKISK